MLFRSRVRTEPFSEDSLVERLRTALPGETITETALLSSYDDYYYSRRQQTPLPVLRNRRSNGLLRQASRMTMLSRAGLSCSSI